MGLLKMEGVTHWSIPVNNIPESEQFYGDLLGLKHLGRLGNSVMSCFNVGDHNILLCEREHPVDKEPKGEDRVHHSFTVSPETFVQHVGAEHILWSTNFPLTTSTWPRTQETIHQCFQGVSAETREKVLWKNAASLYRL